ncbi:MAG: histidine ammonia-lyase [Peptococcaceae bacterium]
MMLAEKKEEIKTTADCLILDGNSLTMEDVVSVTRYGKEVMIARDGLQNMERSRTLVEELLKQGQVVYGVTTGFGKFSTVQIPEKDTETLQENLIISHAVGVGDPLPEEVVRGVMLLRANALVKGFSGIRPEVVKTLVAMLNKRIHPVIPAQGSLGASGDLAPLAHMVLVLLGRGEAFYQGKIISGAKALELADITPVKLKAKEGLALINGTQVMTAIGVLACYDGFMLAKTADIISAMTLEALAGITLAFDEKIQDVRPHPGQKLVADNLRKLLAGSEMIAEAEGERVQDAYALRCIPQVHGASKDALAYVRRALETEINSVTDNPIIFPRTGEVISGGNFHGQPVALALDFLGIAVAELANISERRIERLVNAALSGGLPPFLTREGGLNSGLMITQYVAASLVSENKVLAHPASVDSIPSSANQEDHVSMGTTAARKARQIVENAENVLAIELICAGQGMDLRGGTPAPGTAGAYRCLRNEVEFLTQDRELRLDLKRAVQLLKRREILREVEKIVGFIN